jgi:hypothetical protein
MQQWDAFKESKVDGISLEEFIRAHWRSDWHLLWVSVQEHFNLDFSLFQMEWNKSFLGLLTAFKIATYFQSVSV